MLINDGPRAHDVGVRVAGGTGPAVIERLQAPGVAARTGVTLGGRSFGATTCTGLLPAPAPLAVAPAAGRYAVRLPAAGAVLLTISP